MSLSIERFGDFFRELYQNKQGVPIDPFPWQTRLANQVYKEGWPDCIDLPTASGKTAAIDVAVFALACQAERKLHERTIGRRIFFCVNRRVIVDEAYERSKTLAQRLIDARTGILKEVADALHEIGGDKSAPPIDIAQLRGGIYRERAWARSITQPIIVCTTADQLGSRLLFRGYGVTPSSAPIHAALCGCDSLVLLDEAHVTRALSQTLRLLTRYQAQHKTAPRMHFVQMTATPTGEVSRPFELDGADRTHPILKARQQASKPATLVKLAKRKPIADEIVSRAFAALSESRKAVGIIVNRVQTARDIRRLLLEEIERRTKKDEAFNAQVHLVIGRMRPIDRDDLQEALRTLVGPDRPDVLDNPVFVVATQCLEVGADYDFDVLMTECASIDALRQRFGRLNRKGRSIEVVAAVITNEESLKAGDPVYGDAIQSTWEWLLSKKNEHEQLDFGIEAFAQFRDELSDAMLSPAPCAAVLLPAHLDALCQTGPQPVPSPDVSYFIHGPQRDNAEVNVCWRADLGHDETMWPDIVRLLPPTSPECMVVPLATVARWLGERYKADVDADVPTCELEVDAKATNTADMQSSPVVVWRYGHNSGERAEKKRQLVSFVTDDPKMIRPGDTIVAPVSSRSWHMLGHIPTADESSYQRAPLETDEQYAARCASLDRAVDVAERATRRSKRRLAIRLHDVFPDRADLRGLPAAQVRTQFVALLEKEIADDAERDRLLAVVASRFERHSYALTDDEDPETKHNELIVFKALIDPPDRLTPPALDEDDGDDDLSEANACVALDAHTRHVVTKLTEALPRLSLDTLEATFCKAAELHDIGKADARFQAMLAGVTPYEAMMLPRLLGKSDGRRLTAAENAAVRARAMLPAGFRHEMLSIQIVSELQDRLVSDGNADFDLLLHLIAAHHGYARPFAPVVVDDAVDETLSIEVNGIRVTCEQRKSWNPPHRLDSGVAERFWKLTRKHGWWGLAWLESVLRLADQRASAAEQEGMKDG